MPPWTSSHETTARARTSSTSPTTHRTTRDKRPRSSSTATPRMRSASPPPNFLPEHPFDNGSLRLRDEKLAPFPRTEAAVHLHRREYFAMITHVDLEIGRLLRAVEEAERRSGRETVIVFSGDHGLALGEHGLMGKQSLYDHSTRVPFVVAGPGVPAAQERTTPVYSGSIYATICDLAGVTAPEHLQFPSLVPILDDLPGSDDVEVFTAYGMDQRAVRRGRFKLIAYADAAHDQLFDTVDEPVGVAEPHRRSSTRGPGGLDARATPAGADRAARSRARVGLSRGLSAAPMPSPHAPFLRPQFEGTSVIGAPTRRSGSEEVRFAAACRSASRASPEATAAYNAR